MSEDPGRYAGRKSGAAGNFKKGMNLKQAQEIAANIRNFGLAASGMGGAVHATPPAYAMSRMEYALKVLREAGVRPGFSESTIAAIVLLREGREGMSVRAMRADGSVYSLTLTGGPR